jgi:hypothetical protein
MSQNKVEVNTVKPELTFLKKENSYRILDSNVEHTLDTDIQSLEKYLSETNGSGKTEEQKDMDYAHAQYLWKTLQNDLKSCKLNFILDQSQYTLLTDLILKRLEYDTNTVFIAIELVDLLGSMKGVKFQSDEMKSFQVTATEITYIYHLIQNHKVKGLSKEAFTFAEILRRIGEISKIVSYYDSTAKNFTEDIAKWALSLDTDSAKLIDEIPQDTTTENS